MRKLLRYCTNIFIFGLYFDKLKLSEIFESGKFCYFIKNEGGNHGLKTMP